MTADRTPSTEAGRDALRGYAGDLREDDNLRDAILAIEAEARREGWDAALAAPLNVTMLGEAMAVLNEVYLNDRLVAYRDAERVAAEYARLASEGPR